MGKALDRLGVATPPPAGIAGFRIHFPVQTGSTKLASEFGRLSPSRSTPPPSTLRLAPAASLSGPQHSLPAPVLPGATPQSGSLGVLATPLRMPRLPGAEAALLSAISPDPEPFALPAPEPVERFVFPAMAGALALSAQLPAIASVAAPRARLSAVPAPLPLPAPEPAEVPARAYLDSRPAVRRAVPLPLRFSLHAVDEVVARPKAAPLRSTGPAPALAAPPPIPVESLPVVPAFVPAALAPAAAACLPAIDRAAISAPLRLVPRTAGALSGPRPIPVESLPAVPPAVPVPLPARGHLRIPVLAHFQLAQEPTDALANPIDAPPPEAAQIPPVPSHSAALPAAPGLLLLRRPIQTSTPIEAAAGLDRAGFRQTPPPPAEPLEPSRPSVLPLSRLTAHPAGAQPERPRPAIPQPGLLPLEYHCQRSAAADPTPVLSWLDPAVPLFNPPFQLKPALKTLDAYAPKPRKLLPFEEIFARQNKDGQMARIAFSPAAKIAATIMVGVALWTGSQLAHLSQFRARVAASERNVTAVAEARGGGYGSGPIGAIRRAIADRAAAEITDTFASGMEAWGAKAKAWAPGWQHSPDGYVRTGEMALFRPSLRYTNYHMEFYGQIEQKSIGWVVRARDRKNYLAMKFTVIEPGLRPIIAMQHYQVTNGKRGRVIQTPLNVMVHNNEPYHVAVEVRGNRFSAAIEGEPVDSWADDTTLAQGGIGFFSDPGEHARLYWMKVSRNQDWIGRLCAYLSGDSNGGSRQTAAAMALPGIPQFWALSLAPTGQLP